MQMIVVLRYFFALGYMNKEDSIYLSNLKPAGLTTPEVVDLLKVAYGSSIRAVTLPKNCIINASSHCHGTNILNDNEATVVSIQMISPTENRSHLFIMYTVEDKKLYAFDPQIGVTSLIDDYLLPYAVVPGVSITVSYIDSSNVVEAHAYGITRPMIDHVFPHIPYREAGYGPSDEFLDSI
jgi:hypothetical protein